MTSPTPVYLDVATVIARLSTYPPDAQVGIFSLDSDLDYGIEGIEFEPSPVVVAGTSGKVRKPSVRFTAYIGG